MENVLVTGGAGYIGSHKVAPDAPDCIVCLSERNSIKAGDPVKIKLDERKLHLFDKETELAIMGREFGN